jgi:hypothetical protein
MKRLLMVVLAFAPLTVIHAQTTAPPADGPKVSGFAPLDYFATNCARCHGPYGSFYGASFGKGLKDDAALRQVVDDMCKGPGNAPLEGANVETLTDFHRALRDNKPYIVAVSFKDGVLTGEASPDAAVTLISGDKTLTVKLEEHSWTITPGADFVWKGAKLRAVKDGVETIVEL